MKTDNDKIEKMIKAGLWNDFKKTMTSDVTVDDLLVHNVNQNNLDFSMMHLFNSEFHMVSASDVNLKKTILTSGSIKHSFLHDCDLYQSSFIDQEVENSYFRGSKAQCSTFNRCSMQNSEFNGSSFDYSVFIDSKFHDCDLYGSCFKTSSFVECTFVDCCFEGVDLSDATINDCTFQNCTFDKSRLCGANALTSTFDGCSFIDAELNGLKTTNMFFYKGNQVRVLDGHVSIGVKCKSFDDWEAENRKFVNEIVAIARNVW